MTPSELKNAIVARIHKDSVSYTLTDILSRARSKGHTDDLIYRAVALLHKDKSIKVTVKDNTNRYTPALLRTVKGIVSDAEQRARVSHLSDAWYAEQEALRAKDPDEYRRIEEVFEGIGELVEIQALKRTWLIPKGSEEHYQTLIHGHDNARKKKAMGIDTLRKAQASTRADHSFGDHQLLAL